MRADFDDDGALDLACTNNSGASVSVFRGDGRGGFAAAITVAAPGSPWGLAVVDANADGRPDLLVSNGAGSALTLLRGTGTGTFTNAASIATPLSPRDLAVADFDGDGTPDVAAACAGTNQLALLRGTAGSFASWLVLAAGSGAAGVAVGDFNRDGAADPVSLNTSANSVTRWLGSCAAPAAAAPRLLAPNGGESWWPGTAQTVRWSAAPGTAAVDVELSRDGGATWTALVRGATGDHARVLASGAASERMRLRVRDAAIGWRQDASDTTFALCGLLRAPLASAAGCAANHLAVADLDGDGRLDALAAGGGTARVLRGTGDGRFTALAPFALDASVRVRLADVDGDGVLDLLALGAAGLDWRAGDGAGGFGPAHAVPLAHGVDVTCADFDADGHADAAVLTDDGTSRALVVRSAVGSAPLAAEWRVALDASPRTLAHADFDGDGITDLAVSGSSALEIWRGGGAAGRGDARFALASTRALPGGAGDLALGDFDLDGRLDVVACALATGDLYTVGTESATPAAPTLGVPVTSSAGAAAASPVVTDFDGDGHADVALVDAAAGDVRVLAGAAGGFGAPQVFAGGGGELASGDFDGDGVTDLLVARPDQSAVACLAGMCPPLASASVALRARHDGERFVTGFARRIAWSRESGIALARVELSRDGGMHWVTLAEASADTALAWIVTGPATAHARLRVSDAANPSRADVSGEFAIVAPYGTPRSDAWPGSGTGASALALGASHVATVAAGRVLVAPLGGGAWTDAGEADARSVMFADCDGDGREDLVTRLANFVSVRRALEAGGFGEARMLGTAGANAALVAADFDLDGRADLAVACGTPPAQRVMTFRATAAADDGRAAFAAPGAVALPAAATALVATDVNADGITDLLAGGNGVLATLLGNGTAGRGDGSFRLGATRGFGGGALAALLATDLDRDGATDVAGVDATSTVLGAAGNGAGGFGTPVAFATAAAARALAWGDFDR
ncbi:MAG: VCBS repeat-containing protein, partial [Candidatus Eisenbacteria bacterium]